MNIPDKIVFLGMMLVWAIVSPSQGQTAPSDKSQDNVKKMYSIPSASEQAAALSKIKSIFSDEYAKTGKADQIALARKLLTYADQSGGDVAGQYMLLMETWRLSISDGDVNSALKALDLICTTFYVDTRQWHETTLKDLNRATLSPEDARLAASAWMEECQEAMDAKDIDRMTTDVQGTDVMLHSMSNATFVKYAQEQIQPAREIVNEYRRIKDLVDAIELGQENPNSDMEVGRFYCLYLQDWKTGLPLLSRCNAPLLKKAALADMQASSMMPAVEVAAGDAWWDASAKETALAKETCSGRAAYWYGQAAPKLTGLELLRVQKRIASANHVGTAIDLMKLVDVKKDTVGGKWEATDDGVKGQGISVLQLPYLVPMEYDLQVEVTPEEDNTGFLICLSRNRVRFCVGLGTDGDAVGFDMTDNRRFWENSTTKKAPGLWKAKHRYKFLIKIRDSGADIFMDGKKMCSYSGEYKDLTAYGSQSQAGNPGAVALMVYAGKVEIHSATLVEISEVGKRLR